MKRLKLLVCMIVKNEECYIVCCLESVQFIVDEIIVIDIGLNDCMEDICVSFYVWVYYYRWKQDFLQVRNVSLQYVEGEWILILDVDEELDLDIGSLLFLMLVDSLLFFGCVKVVNYIGKEWDEYEVFE